MTVAGLAKTFGVSPMTVYRRLKSSGISIDELRDSDTGELTNQGAAMIAALFPERSITSSETEVQQHATGVMPQVVTEDRDVSTVDSSAQVAVLETRLDGANALIEQLTDELNRTREQLAAVTQLLAQEQADRQQERLMLSAGASASAESPHDDQQRRGWFYRLFHG